MRRIRTIAPFFILVVLVFGCSQHAEKQQTDQLVEVPEIIKDNSKKKYSGMWEAMQQDFEMTKDVKQGIVPSFRLTQAVERHQKDRIAGRLNRISALSWIERGPTTNTVGPSNGNLRGPSNNAVTSGRTRTIWVDLNDASNKTVWVGSVSGGLWKTTDITASPANWTVVNDFFGNLAVTSITQNPVNKNIMYFGTGEKTNNADRVQGGGIWKSIDNGATWNLLPSTIGFYNVARILCDAAGNVYVATIGTNNGIQRSTDGGTTWTDISPDLLVKRVTEMRLSSTGRLHIVCGYLNGGTPTTTGHRFTDNPATVTPSTWGEPVTSYPTAFNTELAVAGNTLYALPSDANDRTPVIYKSTNGGLTWAPTNSSPPSPDSDGQTTPSINTGQGWYDLAIGVDPANPDVVIAGGLNFFRTENGGGTWSRLSRWVGDQTMYIHADHHSVVWNGTQVLVATDGGVFYSSDNGVTFSDRNVGLRTKQFYSGAIHPTLTNYFIGGTQDNGTHQLNNPGLNGSVEVIGGDGGFTHIDENEPQYQFSAFTQGNFIRSVNGGTSWGRVTPDPGFGLFINPSDYDDQNNVLYASGGGGANAGRYVRWNDPQTGSSFTPVSIGAGTSGSITSIKVSPHTSNRVFFGSNQARVVRVENAQLNFPAATNISGSNFPASGNTVSCVNVGTTDNHLIATFSNYNSAGNKVYISVTGGGADGWQNITGDLPNIPVRWAMFYPEDDDKAIIATEMGIFETDNINGASTIWVRNETFPVVRTNMLQYRPLDRTLLAATHGRGMWTTTLPAAVPYIRFASSYTYTTGAEATAFTTLVCRSYRDYTVKMRVDQAPVGAATVNLVATSGTATLGKDFDFTTNGSFTSPSSTFSFPDGGTAEQTITVRVYNDAEAESTESFTFSYTVTGTTNAVAAPSSQSFTFNIADDDLAPVPGLYSGNFKVGSEQVSLSAQSPLRSNKRRFRIQYLVTASQLGQAGIIDAGYINSLRFTVLEKFSTKPFNGFTIAMANTSSANLNFGFVSSVLTQVYTGNYRSVVGENIFNFSTPFYWDGISNLVVNFCFDNGALSADGAADVVEGSAAPLGGTTRATAYSDDESSAGCSLPVQFVSDTRINLTFGAAAGNAIATAANSTRTEYVSGNGIYHFYNGFEIISRIAAASGNFECVTAKIAEAGTTWQTFFGGPRSQKVFAIDFAGNNEDNYTLGLYMTAAELAGKDPTLLRIAGTTAATVAGANSGNTVFYTTTFAAFGTGYVFSANVTGPGFFFLTEANVTSVRNPSRQENIVRLIQNPVSTFIPLSISNQNRTTIEASLLTNTGQLLQRWNLGRAEGNTQLSLSGNWIPPGTYILRIDAGMTTQSIKLVKQ